MANLRPPWTSETAPKSPGRPKKLTDALDRALTPEITDEVANAIIKRAKKGDVIAFEKIAERIEGKVSQPVDLTASVYSETDPNRLEERLAALLAKREQKDEPLAIQGENDSS